MWRIWRVYCGVTRGEMEDISISRLLLHCTTYPHHPSTSLKWTVSLEETCLIMFILVPHAMCLYVISPWKGARNARPVQGNHQDCNEEKELLSAREHTKSCNQIVNYGTTDNKSLNSKFSNSPTKSVGVNHSKCHSFYEHKHVNYPPQPPDYKWGNENYHKERHHKHFCKDVGRFCKRQRRHHILLTYSVLQAFGWGSFFALSWTIWKSHSLYHHSKQQCPTHYLPFQAEPPINLIENEAYKQILQFCENNEDANKSREIRSSNSFNQQYNYNYIFNPDIDRSLFSYLYSVASNQPVIESNVKNKINTSKRVKYKKRTASHPPDLEVLEREECNHSQTYSEKLKTSDSPLYQPNIDLQHSCLSQICETPKVEPCVIDESTGFLEHSFCETRNDEPQNNISTKTEEKTTREIVTIEDCSESGISSSGSNDSKKIDESKSKDRAEDINQIIQHELNAIRAVQDKVNGFLQGDIGVSLIDTDPESAILHFQAGALLGDSDATYNLALCLDTGKGVKQNYRLARKYYSQASKAGHNWATYNLAVLVSEGLGGPADNDLAYDLLLTAAERGVKEAKMALEAMEEEEQHYDDDLMDTKQNGKTGIIASSQSFPAMYGGSSEKLHSSFPRSTTIQGIDFTNHFDSLNDLTALSSISQAPQKPSFYI